MFEVSYETTFCATHRLMDAGRPIEPLHGHDWRVEVVATGETVNRIGVVIDFERLKAALREVTARFHYKDLNDHPDFAGQSVTAETLARYFFNEVRKALGAEGGAVRRVRVWEAPGCTATYAE